MVMLLMRAYYIFAIILLSIFFLTIILFAIKSHRFIKTLIFNAFFGISILAIIDLTEKFTGIYIPLNAYSVVGSGTFGVPVVCGLLLMQVIFV